MCKIIKGESAFNQSKRNRDKEVGLTKSCKEYKLEMNENKQKALELTYQHLQMRKSNSKITNPWKFVDDNKCLNCVKCRKEKAVKEFATYSSKYNPKLTKACKKCDDYLRKKYKRRKKGERKDEWQWNVHLIKRKTGHVSITQQSVHMRTLDLTKAVINKENSFFFISMLVDDFVSINR